MEFITLFKNYIYTNLISNLFLFFDLNILVFLHDYGGSHLAEAAVTAVTVICFTAGTWIRWGHSLDKGVIPQVTHTLPSYIIM